MVGFYLMGEKGFLVLEFLILEKMKDKISFVTSSTDPSVLNDYYNDVKDLCAKNSIPFYDRNESVNKNTEYTIAISWRWMIPHTDNLIIIHDSLLPKYRGFAPLVNGLINGEKILGATALFAKEDYDTGDIIVQKSISVEYPISIKSAIENMSAVYIEIISELMNLFNKGKKFIGTPQDNSKASYSLWRDEDDYRIDWSKSAKDIERFVMAVGYPYKGASTLIDGKLARIFKIKYCEDIHIENRTPGKVIFVKNNKPVVVCGTGLLCIEEIVFDSDGKNALPLKKFRTRFS